MLYYTGIEDFYFFDSTLIYMFSHIAHRFIITYVG
jgi:hypothetical protein